MSRLKLEPEEARLINALDAFSQRLANKVELRIAGGWVRDKLLGLASHDLDVSISSMTGYDFATQFAAYVDESCSDTLEKKKTTVACIAANPNQSKHLETATASLFNRDIDFVQLRSEEYSSASRIPSEVKFGTPLQDAIRRDLTINALFYNVHTKAIEDWTEKGLKDLLETPLIRCPLPPFQTFLDDPLRILRCIRFASRFGFPLDPSIKEAVARPEIESALREKVSKERVRIELDKMLRDPFALHSLRLLKDIGIYSSIFTPRFLVEDSLPLPEECAELARLAIETMGRLLPPPELRSTGHSSDLDQPGRHIGFKRVSEELLSEPDLRRGLYLAACLYPLRHSTCKEGNNLVWTGSSFLKLDLAASNHDRMFVTRLYDGANAIQKHLDEVGSAGSRVKIGQLLRQKCVEDAFSSSKWEITIFFSLFLEVCDTLENNLANDIAPIIAKYSSFVERIRALNLPHDAFRKPLLNGSEIIKILGFDPKVATAELLELVVAWQLDHPDKGKEECQSWFENQWKTGAIHVERPEPKGSTKQGKKRKL